LRGKFSPARPKAGRQKGRGFRGKEFLSACLSCKAGPRILPAAAGGGQSKVSVRIFFEKSSDFVQDRQLIKKSPFWRFFGRMKG